MARPATHLIASTGLATIQWIRTGRLAPTIAPLLTGFLVDGDHFFEFIRFRLADRKDRSVVILPLHGWEYAILLLLIERLLGKRFAGGLFLGYAVHLGIDQITNEITHPLAYFLTYRWRRGFTSTIFNHPRESNIDWLTGSFADLWKHI